MGKRRFFSLWKPPADREVDDELAFHLEMRAREHMERGLDPESARKEALRQFRDLEDTRRECRRIAEGRDRDLARREWWADVRQDLAYAGRQMARSPGFTLLAVLTLALGIGATTAVFSVLHAVVLEPLPYRDPDRLVNVATTWRGAPSGVSAGNYLYIAERQRSFERMAAAHYTTFNLHEEDSPERLVGARVTHELFAVLGVAPLLGRTLTAEDDVPEQDHVVVLSHRLWTR